MASGLETFARRRIDATLGRFGIADDSLLQALIEDAWAIRQFQVNAPAGERQWAHPHIIMVKRITGRRVEDAVLTEIIAMVTEVIGAVGDNAELALTKAYKDWCLKGRDPKAYGWIKWALTAYSARPSQSQPPIRFVE